MRTIDLAEARAAAEEEAGAPPDERGFCASLVPALLDLVDLQTRALLAAERALSGMYCSHCAVCGPGRLLSNIPDHAPTCPLDAALTAVGLGTQEIRDYARARLGIL